MILSMTDHGQMRLTQRKLYLDDLLYVAEYGSKKFLSDCIRITLEVREKAWKGLRDELRRRCDGVTICLVKNCYPRVYRVKTVFLTYENELYYQVY